jgi:V/A-type H+-transporting ATPase subunit D
MPDRDVAATRIALLELRDERRTAAEGHALLDEKRMLLAARALALGRRLEELRGAWRADWAAAVRALAAAFDRHGRHALETWPSRPLDFALVLEERSMLGVRLADARPQVPAPPSDRPLPPADPSPEAEACAVAWRTMLAHAATLAAVEASLWRLADEYRRTERRTAAIEHLLLPELDAAVAAIEQALEGVEQEEVLRVRRVRGGPEAARARSAHQPAEQRRV